MFSRPSRFRHMYSTWFAYTWGMEWDTVTGRFIITLFSGVGFHTRVTASHISRAKSGSVPVKLSGEYSSRKLPLGLFAVLQAGLRPFYRYIYDLRPGPVENLLALGQGGGIVEVDNRIISTPLWPQMSLL